jgi:hypothetical protein
MVTVIQALINIGVGFAMGARFEGDIAGLLVLILSSILLAVPGSPRAPSAPTRTRSNEQ